MLTREDILSNIGVKVNDQTLAYLAHVLKHVDETILESYKLKPEAALAHIQSKMFALRDFIAREMNTAMTQKQLTNMLVELINSRENDLDDKKKSEDSEEITKLEKELVNDQKDLQIKD